MPPRGMTWAIVAFWLATTGWLVYRQAALHRQSGEPPPFSIDLTDEVAGNTITWNLWHRSEKVGTGKSRVWRRQDRTFELRSEFKFNDFNFLKSMSFYKATGMYRVTAEGQFLALAAEIYLKDLEKAGEVYGEVENGFFTPHARLRFAGKNFDLPLKKIAVPAHGSILNPMHLIGKINGLRDGQQWTIQLLDPLLLSLGSNDLTTLEAKVSAAVLSWNGKEVDCFKIEYSKPDKKMTARTWVRQRDGLVLQQEATHEGKEFKLVREK